MEYDSSCTIAVIGDPCVGKTSVIEKFAGETGDVLWEKNVLMVEKCVGATRVIELGGKNVLVKIIERPYGYSRDANIFIYDVTNKNSFVSLANTVDHVKQLLPEAKMFVLGNKVDLLSNSKRPVELDDAKAFASEKGAKYLECSAAENVGLEEAFREVLEDVLNDTEKPGVNFQQKSKKHLAKLQKLLDAGTEIKKIGPVCVSFGEEFAIGNGCQGTRVYVGLHEDGSEVAVKRMLSHVFKCSVKTDEEEIAKLLNLKKSDNIVNYRDFIQDESGPFAYVILDLCEESLAEYVNRNSKEILKQRGKTIIREILTGLQALHSGDKIILHRDLKPRNILIDSEDRMRLADFGISRILDSEETTLDTSPQGTEEWMAAESIPKTYGAMVKFNRKSDIQVTGMICFYVLTKGEHPFGPRNHRIANILDGLPVNLSMLSDSMAKDFVSTLIRHNMEDRPYVEDALKHPFLEHALS